jgi:hypothetical protein
MSASSDLTWNGSQVTVVGNVTASAFSGDGSGLTGITVPVTPAGSNTEIQFNNAGSLGASSGLTWDATTLEVSGALDISGSVSRQGFLQLGIDATQTSLIDNLNPAVDPSTGNSTIVSLSNLTPTNTPIWTVSWNDVVRKDSDFFSFAGGVITIKQSGDYKVSYSIGFDQKLPHTVRSCMKAFLTKTPAGIPAWSQIDYSASYCYLRGSGGTKWGGSSNTGNGSPNFGNTSITTIIQNVAANDEMTLNFSFFGGATGGDWDMDIKGYQTWITIEKI